MYRLLNCSDARGSQLISGLAKAAGAQSIFSSKDEPEE
jgi:hypothetical protein